MRVLLVEDDKKIAAFILKGLRAEGFAVDHGADGQEGLHLGLTEPYDAAIVDIMLPKLDGFSVAEQIRDNDSKTPIIFLTAKDFKEDKIKGFRLGADDYVTKPFVLEELLLRIEAIIRRTSEDEKEETASQKLFKNKYNRPSKLVGISSDALLRAGLSDPLAQHISNKLKEQQQQDGEMSCCSRILVFNVLFEYGNTTLFFY